MEIPESPEVLKQFVAADRRVTDFLHLAMGGGMVDPLKEFEIAAEVCNELGIDMETFMEGCDIARATMDRAILSGKIDLL